nr:DUF349 domain-containing protein [Microlunatus speluncae]
MSPDADPAAFGRVDADGTVYVRTETGERSVGQVPDTDPAEALQFFVRRFTALELEVSLLERRIASGTLSPDDATTSIKTVRTAVTDANAVGNLEGLLARLTALEPVLSEQRAVRKAERAKQQDEARGAKERCVAEAEKLAGGNDWRGGVNRFRTLLEEWKQLPRLDRSSDGELWHRFSSARTTYTRRRKAHFAQQAEQRDSARVIKERLVKSAEALAGSTEWGDTTRELRGLMAEWKAAGPAPREIDDALWKQFRAAQDQFFDAKQAAFAAQDSEFRDNQAKKEELLLEAEKLVPVKDLGSARSAYREIADRWNDIGKVPREAMRTLDNRMRAVESAIKQAEDDRWRRTNPETRARAEDTAAKLEAQIHELETKAAKAEARGDARAARDASNSAETYRQWLEQARKAASDYSG